jgi:hypothetical protein
MKTQGRRKFIVGGLTLAAIWATVRFWKQPEKKKTMKFLTQDGTLVEVEVDKLPLKKEPASKTDVQNWVKKNKSL